MEEARTHPAGCGLLCRLPPLHRLAAYDVEGLIDCMVALHELGHGSPVLGQHALATLACVHTTGSTQGPKKSYRNAVRWVGRVCKRGCACVYVSECVCALSSGGGRRRASYPHVWALHLNPFVLQPLQATLNKYAWAPNAGANTCASCSHAAHILLTRCSYMRQLLPTSSLVYSVPCPPSKGRAGLRSRTTFRARSPATSLPSSFPASTGAGITRSWAAPSLCCHIPRFLPVRSAHL